MAQPLGENAAMKYVTIINEQQFEIEIDKDGNLTVNGEPREVDFLDLGSSLYSIITNNRSLQVAMEQTDSQIDVMMLGRLYETQVLDERALLMAQRRGGFGVVSGEVHSPMPGLIVAVKVEIGQEVAKGQTVVILESMKMQNELKSPVNGVVQSIHCSTGKTVDKNDTLVIIEPVVSDLDE